MKINLNPAFLFLVAAPLFALDTVVVDTGDRLNGTIERIANGKLHLETSYAGVIQIDWTKVREVSTDARYLIEAETGRRYRGEVSVSDSKLTLVDEDVSVTVDPASVVEIQRVENGDRIGFWDLLQGSVGVGYSFSRGNADQTQASLSAEGAYRQEKYALRSDLSSILSRQEDAEATSRHALNNRYDRFLSDRAFAFGLAAFERNDRQLLDLRSRFGGGFGWKLIRSRNTQFDLLGGVTLTNEQFRAPEDGELLPRDSSGEGLFGFEWQSTRFRGVRLTTRLTAHPNLVQRGRYRIEYDSSARIPLVAGFAWNVSLFDRFDSQPPRADVERNDYGLISTLGFSF